MRREEEIWNGNGEWRLMSRDELGEIVRRQLSRKGWDVRTGDEFIADMAKSVFYIPVITVGSGLVAVSAASIFATRSTTGLGLDLRTIRAPLACFAAVDCAGQILLNALRRASPPAMMESPWVPVASGGVAGGVTGFAFGKTVKATAIGAAAGSLWGAFIGFKLYEHVIPGFA
jgi:hypothetical protein